MKIKVLIGVAIISFGLVSTATGADTQKKKVWIRVDPADEVSKFCDGHNLIYRAGGNSSYGKSIFVLKDGC